MPKPPLLELKNVTKSYHKNTVLKDINLSIKPGEIHGLIGENGAGKSTLMNILFGMPVIHNTGGFSGEVFWHGQPVAIKSPRDAMKCGIGMVHQEFMLIPQMTVCENIKLNKEPTLKNVFTRWLPNKLRLLDTKKMQEDAQKSLMRAGMPLDENQTLEGLPVGHKQFIEIAREVDNSQVQLLVFDEPTAVLTESEALTLLKTIKHLAKDLGIAILFISHRLDEIESVCDKVTVLRDGELIGSYSQGKIDKEKMAELMVGRKVEMNLGKQKKPDSDLPPKAILEMKHFSVNMPGEPVHKISLRIHQGEILGIAGLAGQGKLGISNGLAGLYPSEGQVHYKNARFPLNNPLKALQQKVAFLTEDRRHVGLLLDDSVENNIVFSAMSLNSEFLASAFADKQKIREYALKLISELDIRCQSPTQHTRRLSGGNQQKVCLARIMALNPDILFVNEPTRGVDIGAKKLILQKLVELNEKKGITIVITSSELLELKAISDRIAVVSKGKIKTILKPSAPDKEFGLAMTA